MTKAELNQAISSKTNISLNDVSNITESLFDVLKHEITQGNKVTFKGFGTFSHKKRSAKKVQLIKQRKTISLSEYYIPNFLPSDAFKKQIKSL
jgi:DNA-binding protein HU-beta